MIVLVSLIVLLRGIPCFHDYLHGASLLWGVISAKIDDLSALCSIYNGLGMWYIGLTLCGI